MPAAAASTRADMSAAPTAGTTAASAQAAPNHSPAAGARPLRDRPRRRGSERQSTVVGGDQPGERARSRSRGRQPVREHIGAGEQRAERRARNEQRDAEQSERPGRGGRERDSAAHRSPQPDDAPLRRPRASDGGRRAGCPPRCRTAIPASRTPAALKCPSSRAAAGTAISIAPSAAAVSASAP